MQCTTFGVYILLLDFQILASISDVLARLKTIIEWAKTNNSPLGYFPVVYHLMTEAVQRGIETGVFDDGPRMEKLDVVFAQRYFDAFDAWQGGRPTTLSWQRAFEAAQNPNLTVLQHILLGINAHIDLDLGIAAAQTSPGPNIHLLRTDFDRINTTIANLVDPVQDRLAQIFPILRIVDYLLGARDEHLANRLVQLGRTSAWTVASTLAPLEGELHATAIRTLDSGVAALARPIAEPPGRLLSAGLKLVRWGEFGTVQQKLEKLEGKLHWSDGFDELPIFSD